MGHSISRGKDEKRAMGGTGKGGPLRKGWVNVWYKRKRAINIRFWGKKNKNKEACCWGGGAGEKKVYTKSE